MCSLFYKTYWSWKLKAYRHRFCDQEQVFQFTQLNLNSAFILSVYIYLPVFSLQSSTELPLAYWQGWPGIVPWHLITADPCKTTVYSAAGVPFTTSIPTFLGTSYSHSPHPLLLLVPLVWPWTEDFLPIGAAVRWYLPCLPSAEATRGTWLQSSSRSDGSCLKAGAEECLSLKWHLKEYTFASGAQYVRKGEGCKRTELSLTRNWATYFYRTLDLKFYLFRYPNKWPLFCKAENWIY